SPSRKACAPCITTACSRRWPGRPRSKRCCASRATFRPSMPQFRYTAVEASSETVEGRMEAAAKARVIDRLHASGHVPIRIDEVVASPLAGLDLSWIFRARRMPQRTLALLTGQLATLLHAGLALDEALGILRELAAKDRDKDCLRLLFERISGG